MVPVVKWLNASTSHRLRADARRNRARILEVAREVFATEGLAVPIDTVAARAGIGVGTVYRHFPTKEALFAAIVMDRVQALVDDARAALDADDPGEAFYGFLRMMAERSATDMALADAFAEAGVDIKSSLGVCKQDLTAAIGDLLQRAQDAGAVRTDVVGVRRLRAAHQHLHRVRPPGPRRLVAAPGRRGARRPPAAG